MELHWVRNHIFHIGHQEPSSVSKVNNGVESGTRELENRCHLRAWQALFVHSESEKKPVTVRFCLHAREPAFPIASVT